MPEDLYLSVKQQKTPLYGIIPKVAFFSVQKHSETRKNLRKRINLHPGSHFSGTFRFYLIYFAMAPGCCAPALTEPL